MRYGCPVLAALMLLAAGCTAHASARADARPIPARYAYHGCPLYAPNDWFTTDLISGGSTYVSNSVDPESTLIIENIARNVGSIDFAANSPSNLETVNVLGSGGVFARPRIQGLVWGFADDRDSDDPAPPRIPIPGGAFYQEGTDGNPPGWGCKGGDCHVVVLDARKCVVYETYKGDRYGNGLPYSWNPADGTYWAQAGGVENLRHPYVPEFISTSAGIPMMGTTDWGEDLTTYDRSSCRATNSCVIPHIVAFLLPFAGNGSGGWVAPAVAQQRKCVNACFNDEGTPVAMPEGARLRLHASYPCPAAARHPQANLLCNQLKRYGMILDDYTGLPNGGGIRLGTSADGTDPWRRSDYDRLLRRLTIRDFDVMTLGAVH